MATGSEAWLAAKARSDAILAARPWVRLLVDLPWITKPGVRVPAGTVGREAWRGEGCGELAGQIFVDVCFPGHGQVGLRPDQVEPCEPHPGQLL